MDYESIAEYIYLNGIDENTKEFLNVKEVALKLVSYYGDYYFELDEELKEDIDVVKSFIKGNPLSFKRLSKDIKGVDEVIYTALDMHAANFTYLNQEDKKRRELILYVTNVDYPYYHNGVSYNYDNSWLDPQFYSDEEVICSIAKHNYLALEVCDISLLSNRNVAISSVQSSGNALFLLDPMFLTDEDIVSSAVLTTPSVYDSLDDNMKNNPKVIEAYRKNLIVIDSNDLEDYIFNGNIDNPVMEREIDDDKRMIMFAIECMLLDDPNLVIKVSSFINHNFNYPLFRSEFLGVPFYKIAMYSENDYVLSCIGNYLSGKELNDDDRDILDKVQKIFELSKDNKLKR